MERNFKINCKCYILVSYFCQGPPHPKRKLPKTRKREKISVMNQKTKN